VAIATVFVFLWLLDWKADSPRQLRLMLSPQLALQPQRGRYVVLYWVAWAWGIAYDIGHRRSLWMHLWFGF